MKRWLMVAVLVAISGGALYYSERHKPEKPSHVGPEGMLNAAAGVQREISRIPARVVRLSDQEETQIGDSIAASYGARGGALNAADAATEQYVNDVGRQVAANAYRKLNYRFHYIPQPGFINAFALPGGHVFIGKGLMQLMDSEDELASVLGHEVEHVDHYHCNERVAVEARCGTFRCRG